MKNIETNKEFYVKKQGECRNCKAETLLEENPTLDCGNGLYDLYAITFCTSCGYWSNGVMEDFFTKEEIEEQLKCEEKVVSSSEEVYCDLCGRPVSSVEELTECDSCKKLYCFNCENIYRYERCDKCE